MEKSKGWFTLLIVCVFAAGALFGLALDRKVLQRPVKDTAQARAQSVPDGKRKHESAPWAQDGDRGMMGPGGPPPGAHGGPMVEPPEESKIVEFMARELDLDDAQKEKIKKIFEENKPDITELRDKISGEMDALRDKIDKQIRNELNDEQRKKFDEQQARMKEMKENMAQDFRDGKGMMRGKRHGEMRGGMRDKIIENRDGKKQSGGNQ